MKKIVKQVLGIDVAQKELVVCFGIMYDTWIPGLVAYKVFVNNEKGFDELFKWVTKLADSNVAVRYVMEATGVYHEKFAYYLCNKNLEVSIVLPNKISNYSRSLETKTVTDKTSSEAITLFGLERVLDRWFPAKGIYKQLQQLTRERNQIIEERTVIKNQLHAELTEAKSNKRSIERAKKRLLLLDKQEKEVKNDLIELIKTDEEVKELVMLICTITGIGHLTAVTVLAETNGFELIRNKSQLASYAGLDVREKQSGTSVKGKPTISKRGNKHLRKAMHMPALSAIRRDERFKAIFIRLVSKHGIKMKAVVAVQRKLLEMTYTIFKTRKAYNKNYFKENIEIKEQQSAEI